MSAVRRGPVEAKTLHLELIENIGRDILSHCVVGVPVQEVECFKIGPCRGDSTAPFLEIERVDDVLGRVFAQDSEKRAIGVQGKPAIRSAKNV